MGLIAVFIIFAVGVPLAHGRASIGNFVMQFTHYKMRLLVNNTDLNGPELIEPLES